MSNRIASPRPGPTRGGRKLLVTGAAGFIGSHLVERLVDEGHEVWGLDNFDQAYSPATKRANLREVLRDPRMHLIEGDLRDTVLLDGLFGDRAFDAVLHLAALSGSLSPMDDAQLCFQVNLLGTVNLLEAMRRRGVHRIVFTSDRALSTDVEGESPTEDPAGRPLTAFAAAKRSVELLCHVHHRTYGTSVHVLRLASVYGPREGPEGPIHRIARRLEGDESVVLEPGTGGEFLFVDDAVDGLLASLNVVLETSAGNPVFEILTLTGREELPAGELESRLAAAMGFGRSPDAEPSTAVSSKHASERTTPHRERAAEVLGYRPGVSLEEGLDRFAEWFDLHTARGRLSGSGSR